MHTNRKYIYITVFFHCLQALCKYLFKRLLLVFYERGITTRKDLVNTRKISLYYEIIIA